jgi:hypothetical protein
MFTQTVRELEKTALFPEKFFLVSSQSGIQIDERGRSLENIRSLDQWGVEESEMEGCLI